ncbi:hypothetical protein O7635_10610 [Asanoa sp. WMMD1127]|uniref:hypothetical protein n=1 Tax=Asanoa sp. WMMD1127 TaxID=3016107 RepID=UPI002417BC84|nr:hypothetical protein [Asanoa sp. WMMD1127]MDG4822302.1 hypothetical protein [Asanoa sp. WMMD1127]
MRGRKLAAVAGVVWLLAGCAIGDIRRPPPRPPTPAPATTHAGFETRAGQIPAPPSFHLQQVEFVDQALGYALFARCGSGSAAPGPAETCSAAIVRTDDGGRTWHQAYNPSPAAKGFQLEADRQRLVLYADPAGYYVSRDLGVTYEFVGDDVGAVRGFHGDYQVLLDGNRSQVVRVDADGKPTPTRAQPDVPSLRAVGSALHWLFAAGVDGNGRPVTAVSNDQGATWRQVPVGGSSGRIGGLAITVDRDGTYAWLIGQTDLISWPDLWFFDGQGWRSMGATAHPDRFTSAVPLQDASLAVTTPERPGLVAGGAFQWVDWPIGGCHLRMLADGTLFCAAGAVNWLGVGRPGDWKWIRVLVGNE